MKDPKFQLIVPAFKAGHNMERLINSIAEQDYENWHLIISCDHCRSTFDAAFEARNKVDAEIRSKISISNSDKRQYALKNIVSNLNFMNYWENNFICGVIDGDDQLCNNQTLSLIAKEYEKGSNVVWTQYKRDDNGECVSNNLPDFVDPYKYQWVSSHFRTFGSWIYEKINTDNFKDEEGNFFKRAYDQALMLPILYHCNANKLPTKYIPEVCYQYNHDGSSTPQEEHSGGVYEGGLARFIRERGFIQ